MTKRAAGRVGAADGVLVMSITPWSAIGLESPEESIGFAFAFKDVAGARKVFGDGAVLMEIDFPRPSRARKRGGKGRGK